MVEKGWERERIKKKSFIWVPTRPVIENLKKKIAKILTKFKKEKKDTITASFQAKISWERLRKRENKKNRSNEFLPDL